MFTKASQGNSGVLAPKTSLLNIVLACTMHIQRGLVLNTEDFIEILISEPFFFIKFAWPMFSSHTEKVVKEQTR